jgi:hypothetical protein
MAARNTRTVGPKKSGGWEVSGTAVKPVAAKTQTAGVAEARRQLARTGGGELKVKGRDGKIRDTTTIARKDPRKTKG